MKNFYFIIFLLSPLVANADNKPPPGYWSYDGQAISFCFKFNQEDVCSKLPMDKLRKIILESDGLEENLVSTLYIDNESSQQKQAIILKQ